MPRLNREWTVAKHTQPKWVTGGILTVESTIKMPLGSFPRRMTAIALANGRSAIFSPVSLDKKGMKKLEGLGEPRYLIVPNAHHRLDLKAWADRFPHAYVLAPDGARSAVEDAASVAGNQALFKDADAQLLLVAGTGASEFALKVRRDDGVTLIVNDIIAHVAHPQGLMAKLMARAMGFGVKEPQIPRVVRRLLVKDRIKLARQMLDWADEPELVRIIPSHGEIITKPYPALTRIAASLER